MTTTKLEQEQRSVTMYGVRDIEEYMRGAESNPTFKLGGGHSMMAMSLLSDAQEEMFFDADMARKTVNRAKYIIIHYMTDKVA